MADGIELNAGSGGSTIDSDEIGGKHYPRSKLIHGADGTNDGDVSKANPLPVGFNTAKDGSGSLYAPVVDSDGHIQIDVLSCASHAVTNAGTFAVQAAQSGTWNITNVSGTISLPTGAATAAKQPALGTAGSASADVITIQGVASMTPVQVSQATASNLNATVVGTGTFSVQASAVVPGTGATNLGKAIDSAAGATDTGVAILAVRDDSLSSLTPAEGDYVPLRVNSTGALHVTGGGGGTQYAVDDVAGAADTGTLLLAIRDDSLATLTPADGDYVGLRVSSTGALHVTGGGGGTEYTEDVATPNPIVGTATMMERDDALATLTPAEGDWAAMRCSSTGALWVAVDGTLTVASHAVTNAGTFAVQVTSLPSSTNTIEVVGDAAHDAAVAGNPLLMGAYASGSAPSAVSGAGDAVRLWAQLNGALCVAIVDGNGNQAACTAGGKLAVSGDWEVADDAAFTVGGNGVAMAGFTYIAAGDSVQDGDAGAGRMSANRCQFVNIRDNAGNERGLNIDASGQIAVTLAAGQTLGTVTTVSTVTAVTTVSTVTTCSTVTTLTGSGVAHDGADSGNPHKIGMKATGAMTGRTLVAADDRTDLFAGLDGVQISRPHAPLEDQLQENKTNTDGASTAMTGGFAAPGANIRLYLTTLIISNSSATFVTVDIRDGSAGAVLMTVPVPATGGVVLNLPVPLKFTANTAAAFDGSAAASTISVTMIGFKSKAG